MIKRLLKAFLLFVGFGSAQKIIIADECFSTGTPKKALDGLDFIRRHIKLARHETEIIDDTSWRLIDGRYEFQPAINDCVYNFIGANSPRANEIECCYTEAKNESCRPFLQDFKVHGMALPRTRTNQSPHLLVHCGMWRQEQSATNSSCPVSEPPNGVTTDMCEFKFVD